MNVPPAVLGAVADLLRARAVEPLDDLTTSGRAAVLRMRVLDGDAATAILKLGGDHAAANRCGLAFMNAVLPDAGPRLLGAGADFVVMEDLGGGPSLKSALAGDDPALAEAALVAHASALGRLAAATRGRRDEYVRLVRELGGPAGLEPSPSEAMLTDAWSAVGRELPGLGLRATAAGAADLDLVRALWRRAPGAFSFSPGDTCPDNTCWRGTGVRFFDVDFCSFHPTALDAAHYARPHFPTCNYLGELPAPTAGRARAAFARHVSVDEEEVHAASTAWTVLNAGWLLATALAGDRRLGPTTYRHMLLWRLTATAEQCRAARALMALGTLLSDLAGALAERWPEVGGLPPYPAFEG